MSRAQLQSPHMTSQSANVASTSTSDSSLRNATTSADDEDGDLLITTTASSTGPISEFIKHRVSNCRCVHSSGSRQMTQSTNTCARSRRWMKHGSDGIGMRRRGIQFDRITVNDSRFANRQRIQPVYNVIRSRISDSLLTAQHALTNSCWLVAPGST
jgi:hypothetical protein